MHTTLTYAFVALAAYLLGAIPFGLLVARLRGVDIRTVGSRNIGATNVFRCVGKGWGILTFLLDMGKGYAGAMVLPWLVSQCTGDAEAASSGLKLLGGAMAVAGHNWPVYLGFKGGKGVATSAGMLLGLAPAACGVALAAWIVVLLAGRYVSLASIVAAVVLAVTAWMPRFVTPGKWHLLPLALTLLAILAIARHHANIRRLMAGTESRFSLRRREEQAASPKP
ncbi:MAG: glycerol-3-phosphate 1-O-acyltransferase PlsY [Kiritimatiellae bacterium]|nr:glycerol-3-phosphate 1-O-acyltransferase PlsY [Kiritimatiellia bacterium]